MSAEREAFEKWFEGKNPFLHRFETDAFFAGYQAGRAALLAEIKATCYVDSVFGESLYRLPEGE